MDDLCKNHQVIHPISCAW